MAIRTPRGVEELLHALLTELVWRNHDEPFDDLETDTSALHHAVVETYEEASLLTYDRGIRLRLANGSEFQITIIQSALPRLDADEDEAEDAG